MTRTIFASRALLVIAACSVSLSLVAGGRAQDRAGSNQELKEPVFRLVRSTEPSYPMDPALHIARQGLARIQADIADYTCTMVKRERVDGELLEPEYMFCKIRNRKVVDNRIAVPLSVYMKFLKPRDKKGREVIWVEGQDDGKIVAHGSGPIEGKIKVKLDPNGAMAMKGNRYPITDAGIENLIVKLIEKGEHERKLGNVEVNFYKNATINGRVCTLIEVIHPEKRAPFEYNIARIYIDDELRIPIRFASWEWPAVAGGSPQLLEEYTYLNIKLNVGLTDLDFDSGNPNYAYPY